MIAAYEYAEASWPTPAPGLRGHAVGACGTAACHFQANPFQCASSGLTISGLTP